MYTCTHVYMLLLLMHIHAGTYTHTCTCSSSSNSSSMYTYIHVYVYTCTHVHMYTRIHVYMCTCTRVGKGQAQERLTELTLQFVEEGRPFGVFVCNDNQNGGCCAAIQGGVGRKLVRACGGKLIAGACNAPEISIDPLLLIQLLTNIAVSVSSAHR